MVSDEAAVAVVEVLVTRIRKLEASLALIANGHYKPTGLWSPESIARSALDGSGGT